MSRLGPLCRLTVCALLIAVILPAVPPLSGQDFFEIVDVPLVEVDVLVTDNQGRPVNDLSEEDFSLLVDGDEQEISFFVAPQRPDSAGGLEAGSLPAHLVILFDNNGVERQNRNAVIEAYRDFLNENSSLLQQIMVATVSLAGLEIQQEFTNEFQRTDAALQRVAATVARDVHAAEYESLLRDIQKLAGARDPTLRDSTSQTATLVSRIIAFSDRARRNGQQIASYLRQLTEALAGLPGQRSILYVGGAVSVSPGESLLTALKGILDRSGDGWAKRASANLPAGVAPGGSDHIDALSRVASVQGVAIYSFMVGGGAQVLSTGTSASSITAKDSSAMDSSGSWSPGFDSRIRSESRSALEKLAAATGGFVHGISGGARPALERIHDQLSSRYVLGFHPPTGADGKPHKIRVQVEGTRLRVRHRGSFQARSWDEETAARVQSSLLAGGVQNPHELNLEARVPERASQETLHVPLILRFPLSSLAIEPIRDTHRGQASVFVTGLGARRFDTIPVRKSVLPVVLQNDDLQGAMGQMAEYRLDVEVPEDARSLAVAVRDDLSTELSIVRLAVPVDKTVRVEPSAEPAPDQVPFADQTVPVRLPSAALLMSGQQGGSLRLERDESPESGTGDPFGVGLVVRVPEKDTPDTSMNLEIHAYVLDSSGLPLSRAAGRAPIDPTPEGTPLDVPIEIPATSETLSVLVRDVRTNDFGITRISLDVPATTGRAAGSGGPILRLRIATGETEVAEVAQKPRESSGEPAEKERVRVPLEKVSLGLVEVMELAASGRASEAQSRLRDLEIDATGGRSPMAVVDLGKREARVIATMADGSWERMLPLALLWGELIDDYRRRGLGPLSEHAIAMSTQLATTMARRADTPESKAQAADLLVSLSGFLLYSQRLGKTEELLELATKIDGKNEQALMALSATREQHGDFAGAIRELARLLELSPASGEGRLRLAVNLFRTDHSREAEALFVSLCEEAEEEWVAKVSTQELARLMASSERAKEAQRVLETAVDRWPDDPAMQVQLAWLLDRRNSPEEADERISRVARGSTKQGDSPRFRYHRWYLEGLVGLRQELSRSSAARARETMKVLSKSSVAEGGS